MFILKNSIGKSLPEKCIALLRNYYCSGQKKGPIGMEYNFFLNFHIFHSILMLMLFFFWQNDPFFSMFIRVTSESIHKISFFFKGKRGINLKFEDGHNLYLTLCIFSPFELIDF